MDRKPPFGTGAVMLALGCVYIVIGGLVAAFTGPFGWGHGSWAAAFLVLVLGVAQAIMGWMRAAGTDVGGWGWLQVAAWNVGGLLIIAGTPTGVSVVVDLGAVLMAIALVLALIATRSGQRSVPRPVDLTYRGMLLVLAVSIPVGILLAHSGS